MTLGFPTDKASIDSWAPTVIVEFRESLDKIQRLKTWLDTQQDSDLTALGYSAGEVAVLKSAFTDLNQAALVIHGQATQAQVNDFLFWARKLTGMR